MPLPLLHLPLLVVNIIIDFLTPLELLILAQTSQKRLKIYTKSLKIDIKVYCGVGWSYVAFRNSKGESLQLAVSLEASTALPQKYIFVAPNRSPVLICKTTVVTYWHDYVHGFKSLIDFFKQTFNLKTASLYCSRRNFSQLLGVVEHIKERELKLDQVEWLSFADSVERAQNLLTYFSSASRLTFLTPYYFENMSYDNFQCFSLNQLVLSRAFWVTVDNLCGMVNCRNVVFDAEMGFTSQDLNKFLKRWMEGCRLEWLEIKTKRRLKEEQVMEGIDRRGRREIHRADGTKAKIRIETKSFELVVFHQ